jgi:hypothetical protein
MFRRDEPGSKELLLLYRRRTENQIPTTFSRPLPFHARELGRQRQPFRFRKRQFFPRHNRDRSTGLLPVGTTGILPRFVFDEQARRLFSPRARGLCYIARKQKASRGGTARRLSKSKPSLDYGLGLDVVVVVLVEVDEFGVVAVVVVLVLVVSLVFSFSVVGFTTVVWFSTFLSGTGEVVVGVTTVLSSQPPRSAAPAKMQSSFFIGFGLIPILGQS